MRRPTNGRAARQVASLVAAVRAAEGMNVKVSFFGDGRTLITIHFRTDDGGQVRRAEACEARLWAALAAAGFPPYRVSIDQMSRLMAAFPERFELVRRLKASLDPNGIMAPGRYGPVDSE